MCHEKMASKAFTRSSSFILQVGVQQLETDASNHVQLSVERTRLRGAHKLSSVTRSTSLQEQDRLHFEMLSEPISNKSGT